MYFFNTVDTNFFLKKLFIVFYQFLKDDINHFVILRIRCGYEQRKTDRCGDVGYRKGGFTMD